MTEPERDIEYGTESPLARPSPTLVQAFGELGGDLEEVLGSAARAADRVTERAEAETQELAEQRREELTRLSEELAEQASAVRARSNDLMRSLEEQTRTVEGVFGALIESLSRASSQIAGEDAELTMSQRRSVTITIPRRPRVGDPDPATPARSDEESR